jgi:hypothetical protein
MPPFTASCARSRNAPSNGESFAGIYKGAGYESAHGLVEETESNDRAGAEHQLVAGTAPPSRAPNTEKRST